MTRKSLVFCLLCLLFSQSARAFSFSPMSLSFDPVGPGASRAFQVHNDSETPIAVELSLASREMDLDGNETSRRTPEIEKEFLLFPPQVVLKPNETKTVRVTWVGSAEPPAELAYRIIAEQLPVDLKKQETASKTAVISILLKYIGAVYITPRGAEPRIILKETAFASKNDSPFLSLTFENQGKAHRTLNGLKLKVRPAGSDEDPKPVLLTGADLKGVDGQNILAGKSRRFFVPWPPGLRKGPVRVEFEIQN